MNKENYNFDKNLIYTETGTRKLWISTTGYRTLIILKALMISSYTINELVEILKSEPLLKALSKDTIRLTIKTLKNSGCEISRPSKANGYRYELLSNPYVLHLSEEEIEALDFFRIKFSETSKWQDTILMNKFVDKIASLTFDEGIKRRIKQTQPLKDVTENTMIAISNPAIINKKVNLTYLSPAYGLENLEIVPKKVVFLNGKMYLRCFNYKYMQISSLNAQRIVKLNNVGTYDVETPCTSYDVFYKVDNDTMYNFKLKDYEEIIEKTPNYITVLAHVENEFFFIQRLFMLAPNFAILSPNSFKQKLINKLKSIREMYKED
jgi:hypothetical protein